MWGCPVCPVGELLWGWGNGFRRYGDRNFGLYSQKNLIDDIKSDVQLLLVGH